MDGVIRTPFRPELVAPAGDMERLRTAIHFGADAVYLSGRQFSLRSFARNFTFSEMAEAIEYAHEKGARVYLAANSFLRNQELPLFQGFLQEVAPLGFDALIVSDPAALEICREEMPGTALHLSTQVNTLNRKAARFWFDRGIERIILARELSAEEIREIREDTGGEVEIFVHGALCMAYSGRCMLSLYLADRDANQGLCTQPCRWKYALQEETRPGQYFPVEEDGRGTYILNSRDLCLLDRIPEMVDAGVTALKIEGRRKGIHYLAGVVKAYRHAIDCYCKNPETYRLPDACREEVLKVRNRSYTAGFFGREPGDTICSETDHPPGAYALAGVIGPTDADGWTRVDTRNRIRRVDTMEQVGRGFPNPVFQPTSMRTGDGEELAEVHANNRIWMRLPETACPGDLLRIRNPEHPSHQDPVDRAE